MGKPLPTLSYTHLEPYKPFNGAVTIRQSAQLDERTTQSLDRFIKAPNILIQEYAQGRFATASSGLPVKSVFDIQKMSFRKKSDEDNIIGILSGAAAEYYTLNLYITMSQILEDGSLWKPYEIKIKRELLIQDNLSLAEKEFRQFEFLEKIIGDIDRTVTGFMPHMK